ncbi:MAG: Beta-carotene ketolase [uncultured Sphingomonas sp.]|uniref:Beta-carotene ketolase n=1 Tax=uncultured Sphingomonas sp. TaxID=158754 RepID=A0A6J4SRR8_9SPHN|nr:MAG: Beta-carotene ketolase [uncultured Sphingomonas sp.]
MLTAAQQRRQATVGLLLAVLIVAAWLSLHVYAVFFHSLSAVSGWLWALPLVLALIWLSVGLFIVAHDAMHGSLAPGRPALNRFFGRLTLLLYAGFWMDRLAPKHFDHHRHVGTDRDPDFSADHPTRFWPWYLAFMRRYFGLREAAILTVLVWSYVLLLGAPLGNLLLFWALPSIASSVQLFYFGTYLPHRHEESPFADEHRARSNEYGWLASLLTCFHFGYHREHHLSPGTPWWALPAERQRRKAPLMP